MAENRKEFKFSIEQKDYPKRLLKDLESHIKTISKEHREIPKSLEQWKKELSFLKYETSDLTTRLEKQQRVVHKLSESMKSLKGKDAQITQVEIDKSQRKMDSLQNRMDKQTRMVASVGTYTSVQENALNKTSGFGNVMNTFATGGVAGVASNVWKSGVGKLGIAGLGVYGLMKTYDWVQQKSQAARDYKLKSLHLSRGTNLPFDMSEMIEADETNYIGSQYKKTPQQVLEMAGLLSETTGRALIKAPKASVEKSLGFAKYQNVEYGQVAGILGTGYREGAIKGVEDISKYFNQYTNAMAKGLELGISKSESIKQLINLTRVGAQATGEITKEGFNRLTSAWLTIQQFGGVAFKGEKGQKALSMMGRLLQPSETTTPVFAMLRARGLIPEKFQTQALAQIYRSTKAGGMGISKEVYEGLLPGQQLSLQQSALKGTAADFDVFMKLWEKTKGAPFATSLMGKYAGAKTGEDVVTVSRILSMPIDQMKKAYEDLQKEIQKRNEDPIKQNLLGLQAETSEYVKGTTKITQSMTALESIIGTEVTLRKFELMVSKKLRGISSEKFSKMSTEELAVMLPMLEGESKNSLIQVLQNRGKVQPEVKSETTVKREHIVDAVKSYAFLDKQGLVLDGLTDLISILTDVFGRNPSRTFTMDSGVSN